MSERWPGGIISKTAPTPSGPFQNSTAPGVWTLEQQAYWQKQGQWPTAGNLPNVIEDVFSTYLYTGTGAAQIIPNGIALGNGYTAGTTGGSGLFNGTNNFLSVPTGTALSLTGDFTIECWVYQIGNAGFQGIFGNGEFSASSQIGFTLSSGSPALYVGDGSSWAVTINPATPIPLNAWTHIAATCSGSTFTLWVNGVSFGTATYSGTRATPLATSVIGRLYVNTNGFYMNGYMSNFRIVKGTALYTSNFTVPSSPLTAVSGTQLLCLQGATPFVDNSANALTITNNNSTSSSSLGPFPYTFVEGKGGMVWLKRRSPTTQSNGIFDTVRGEDPYLVTNTTDSQFNFNNGLIYNNNGFILKSNSFFGGSGAGQDGSYVSWTFREQTKFFDIVTYTGNGAARTIAHNLGSVPGMIIVKCTSLGDQGWRVWHRSFSSNDNFLALNNTNAVASASTIWNSTAPTSTVFSVGTSDSVNASGQNYVAYLFAHNAGGFGLSGNENVISCGSFTTDSSWNATVNLGYEPQFLLYKSINFADAWAMIDIMRNWSVGGGFSYLQANSNSTELTYSGGKNPTATGFEINTGMPNQTYIYMAIRRGPMATPTLGTSVFSPVTLSGNSSGFYNATINPDLTFVKWQSGSQDWWWVDRLRGNNRTLSSNSTAAEATNADYLALAGQANNTVATIFANGNANATWNFRRAPGFFDIVCYTGDGTTNRSVNHNLGVVPEIIIVKSRNNLTSGSASTNWAVNLPAIKPNANDILFLNNTLSWFNFGQNWFGNAPVTSSTFPVNVGGTGATVTSNASGETYVAYLFASVAGVSKVGSYTGTGTTQTINCGFTTGARFVLIKRTDSTGDWYVWDSARGIVAGNDPYLLLNSTAAEVTNTDFVDTASSGFEISSTAPAAINANGGTFIFLAIA